MTLRSLGVARAVPKYRPGHDAHARLLARTDYQEGDGRSLLDDLSDFLIGGIRGDFEARKSTPDEVETARKLCRDVGNPFPLIGLQWPSLVIDDPYEAEIFEKHRTDMRFSAMTERVRRACLDRDNPPLRLDWWQYIILAAFFDDTIPEIYIKGCTGAGKGGSTAMGVNIWFDVYEETRVTLTSESFDHALKNIFGEVVKWRRRMAYPQPARVLTESITESERHYVVVRNPRKDSGEAFSGQHGPRTMYLFDEATATPSILRENCEKNASKIVALANPRTLNSWFRDGFEPLGRQAMDSIGICYGNIGQRLCVTVGGTDCINVAESRLRKPVSPRGGITINGVTYEQGRPLPPDAFERVKALIPDQIDLQLFRNNCSRPDVREVAIYAHGKFPDEDPTKQVILSSWLPRHNQYWLDHKADITIDAFGLDVARSLKGDSTVLTSGGRKGVLELHDFKFDDVIKIAAYVIHYVSKRFGVDLKSRQQPVCVDYAGGYGSGVGDALKNAGVWVMPFQPSGRPSFPEWFANLRTEVYGLLGRRLDPAHLFGAEPFALPPDAMLAEELTAPEKVYGSDAIRFIVEPKDSIKEKLRGRSPDRADSVTYFFHAVRVLCDYDTLIRSYQRPLMVFPQPETPEERRDVDKVTLPPDEERRPAYKLDLSPAGLKVVDGNEKRTATSAVKPADKWAELAKFYEEQYGSRGE